nr:MAG TPA: hypothetical protein [Caudoviricetes sp.]
MLLPCSMLRVSKIHLVLQSTSCRYAVLLRI